MRVTPARLLRNTAGAAIVVVINVALIAYVVTAVTGSSLPVAVLASRSLPRPAPSTPTATVTLPSAPVAAPGGTARVASTTPTVTQPPRLSPPTTSVPDPSTPASVPRPTRPAAASSTSAPTTAPSTPTPAPSAVRSASPSAPSTEGVHAVVDVGDPIADIAPDPNFLDDCGSTSYNDSTQCVSAVVAAIDNARADGGLGAMDLPTNWTSLSPAQQLFVATNLERTARGLPAISALAGALDVAAAQSAASGSDPVPPLGFPARWWTGNWAGALGNPLEAMYYWMYDDGLGSPNVACTATDLSGCWGHRRNVLVQQSCTPCVAGAAWGATGNGAASATEVIVGTPGPTPTDFTWQQELPFVS